MKGRNLFVLLAHAHSDFKVYWMALQAGKCLLVASTPLAQFFDARDAVARDSDDESDVDSSGYPVNSSFDHLDWMISSRIPALFAFRKDFRYSIYFFHRKKIFILPNLRFPGDTSGLVYEFSGSLSRRIDLQASRNPPQKLLVIAKNSADSLQFISLLLKLLL